MPSYKIEVKNKETGEWETSVEGDAKSRRQFLKSNGQVHRERSTEGRYYWTAPTGKVKELIKGKSQWRAIKAE